MAKILVPLPDLQLDPRNTETLLSSIQTKIYLESNGTLNDFTAASPLSALTEGQAYAQSELLYYLNALPEAFTLQWLKLMGIQRIIGSHSYADMLFIRQPGYTQGVLIPQGTEFFTGGGLKFILLSPIELTSSEPVIGHVRSEKWGQIYNVPAGSITRLTSPILGLGTFYNPQPSFGGDNEESVGEMKSRALSALSRRSLTTKDDYIFETLSLFPEIDTLEVFTYDELESFIGGLAQNYVYICYATQEETLYSSEYMSSEILKALRLKSPLGSNISIIDPEINKLRVDLTIEYSPSSVLNVEATCSEIFQNILNTITFSNKPLGSILSTNEIISAINFVIADSFISNVTIGALKLFQDLEELGVNDGCSDEYITIIDDDNICLPDYYWSIDTSNNSTYVPAPYELYKIYEVNITMVNLSTANSLFFTFKNV